MLEQFVEWFNRWKYRLLYPYMRRKDAGYLANVLSEYASFPVEVRRARLKDFADFTEVERCHAALLAAHDDDLDGEAIRRAQLRQVLGDAPTGDDEQNLKHADPITRRIWLQSYMRQVFLVEKAVLQLQDFPALHARAPMLLERFRSVVDQKFEFLKRQHDQELSAEKLLDLWQKWSDDAATDAARKGIETWLRSRMTALLNDIQWSYAQSQVREELFLSQQIALFGTFLGIALLTLLLFHFPAAGCNTKLPLVVMFFGLLGAFTSIMRRMRNDSDQHGGGAESSFKELTALAYGKIGITFSLLFGVIFSLVLMLFFQSGLTAVVFSAELAKTAFPTFPVVATDVAACTAGTLVGLPGPGLQTLGKLLVWSFAAGFIERLVPDALDRLTKAAETKKP